MSTSKFDELMKFIDSESIQQSSQSDIMKRMNPINNSISRQHDARRHSNISDFNYQQSMSQSTIKEEKSYIWDEEPTAMPMHSNSSRNISTNSTITANSSSSSNHLLKYGSNSDFSAVSQMIGEVESKIKAMKDNIKKKSKEIQEYHEEAIRLQNAIEKRKNKFQVINEGVMNDMRKEQEVAMESQNKIFLKLKNDLKDLNFKYNALLERHEQLMSAKATTIDKAKKEMEKKIINWKKQSEADEKVYFESIATKKLDIMKKTAVDGLAPKLDKYVSENYIKIQKRQNEIDMNIQKLKTNLQVEIENGISKDLDEADSQHTKDLQKLEYECQQKLTEIREKQNNEISALKDKQKRNIIEIEDNADKIRRIDADNIITRIKDLRTKENEQMSQLRIKQQSELGALAEECSAQLIKIKEKIGEEIDSIKKMQLKQNAIENEKLFKQKQSELQSKYQEETQQILDKLKAESDQERKKNKINFDSELREIRLHNQTRLDELHDQYKQLSETLRSLTSDISSSEMHIDNYKMKIHHKEALYNDQESEITKIKNDLKIAKHEYETLSKKVIDMKKRVTSTKGNNNGNGLANSMRDINEDEEYTLEMNMLNNEFKDLKERNEAEMTELIKSQEAEIKRVNEKISILYQRRDENINKLRQQLQEYQHTEQELMNELNDKREKRLEY